MFTFENLKQIHLEISNNCQASCPMCARNIHGGIDNPLIKNQNWTLDEFKKIITQDVLNQIEGMYFCGNFGDPILNNDLIEMCQYVSINSPDQYLRIHTNGSARQVDWWKTLAKVLPKNHNVIFALDGVGDTHEIYRIGTKYNLILQNALAFIEAGGIAEWCFIKFKHNEHQEEQAKEIAKQYGFKKFTVKNSSRFVLEPRYSVKNKNNEHLYYIEPPTTNKLTFIDKNTIDSYKEVIETSTIHCYADRNKEIYIDAYRNVFPCCWLASIPYTYIEPDDYASEVRNTIVDQYNELINSFGGIERVHALTYDIKTIINSYEYQNLWNEYWTTKKLIMCARICGKMEKNNLSKPSNQFVEVLKLND